MVVVGVVIVLAAVTGLIATLLVNVTTVSTSVSAIIAVFGRKNSRIFNNTRNNSEPSANRTGITQPRVCIAATMKFGSECPVSFVPTKLPVRK